MYDISDRANPTDCRRGGSVTGVKARIPVNSRTPKILERQPPEMSSSITTIGTLHGDRHGSDTSLGEEYTARCEPLGHCAVAALVFMAV